ncbi:MAG: sodium-dependent transporter [Alistipes sp.]|nr:sodium-dependent transporter [Alistipes sp.]MBQ6584997.1 sodium-dependent transporter [Alistipes sp.]
MEKRDSFGSKIGAILVAAGSAIGLGSIWRFPYMTGENGGGGFLLIYLLSVLIVGIPVMLAEFSIGTYTRNSPVKAYNQLSPRWKWLGYNSVIVSLLISGFYYIVAGWSLEYFVSSANGVLYQVADFHQHFAAFTNSWREPLYTVIFIIMTHTIVVMGVQKGLERISKIVMPVLLIMLVLLVIHSATMSGAVEGYKFLFYPDFKKAFSVQTIVSAIGQAFFSLSIGLGCMIAYSSYFKEGTNLTKTSFSVSLMTFFVAILSGMVIFPAVFSVEGLEPTAGPTLLFETMPFIFAEMPASELWSALFFLLVVLAALTSTISFHEVLTQYLQENHNVGRKNAARITTAATIALSIVCLKWSWFFDSFDVVTADVLMPMGGLLTSIFAGWVLDRKILHSQMSNNGTLRARVFPLLVFALKWAAPILLSIVFVWNLLF